MLVNSPWLAVVPVDAFLNAQVSCSSFCVGMLRYPHVLECFQRRHVCDPALHGGFHAGLPEIFLCGSAGTCLFSACVPSKVPIPCVSIGGLKTPYVGAYSELCRSLHSHLILVLVPSSLLFGGRIAKSFLLAIAKRQLRVSSVAACSTCQEERNQSTALWWVHHHPLPNHYFFEKLRVKLSLPSRAPC